MITMDKIQDIESKPRYSDLEYSVLNYYENNETKKRVEKEVKKYGSKIKDKLVIGDKQEFKNIGLLAEFRPKKTTRVVLSTLEAKLDELVKTNPEIEDCFITTRTIDQDKVAELIANGTLNANLLEECTETKTTGALYVSKLK